MKSIQSFLLLGGVFVCLMIPCSGMGMQKNHIAPLLCTSCTESLEQRLDYLTHNPNEKNRTIKGWSDKNKTCQNCIFLKEQMISCADSEHILQIKREQDKLERLLSKAMLFTTAVCTRGTNKYSELDIPLNIICLITFVMLAYEAFCNNPRKHYE